MTPWLASLLRIGALVALICGITWSLSSDQQRRRLLVAFGIADSLAQAVVRWQGEALTRAVARHEIAHLALGNWLGRTPLWLNEGLAELVERMRFRYSAAASGSMFAARRK